MSLNTQKNNARRGGAARFWRGEDRLWKAFWLLWVLGWWAVGTIAVLFQNAGGLPSYAGPTVLLLYMIWAGVGVWRCAFNVEWRGWGYIARSVVVLFVVLIGVGLATKIPV